LDGTAKHVGMPCFLKSVPRRIVSFVTKIHEPSSFLRFAKVVSNISGNSARNALLAIAKKNVWITTFCAETASVSKWGF